MSGIKESRKISISERVFGLSDIVRVARLFESELQALRDAEKLEYSNGSAVSLKFVVEIVDGSQFESESIALFDNDAVVSERRVKRIEIELTDYEAQKSARLSITHGDYLGSLNELIVSGYDNTWVNGITRKLEQAIGGARTQSSFVKKYCEGLRLLLAFPLGYVVVYVVAKAFAFLAPTPEKGVAENEWALAHPELVMFLAWLLVFAFGYFPAELLVWKLRSLWPSIELQIGPEHSLLEMQRRLWIWSAITAFFFPAFLAFGPQILSRLL
ncbi:hypothetical protein ABC977_13735 [Thioalkalicoccus limnaeus]|uniref:Uncharacterized protein n=1 Tax=Thioalkalicoccus limnaeus TaxID=120681 RepID=A0ABV4BGQ4_9GAMM